MADQKYLERIENLIGTGQVYEGSKEITKARYSIEVLQEILKSRTRSEIQIIDELKEIRGTVNPISASIYISTETN